MEKMSNAIFDLEVRVSKLEKKASASTGISFIEKCRDTCLSQYQWYKNNDPSKLKDFSKGFALMEMNELEYKLKGLVLDDISDKIQEIETKTIAERTHLKKYSLRISNLPILQGILDGDNDVFYNISLFGALRRSKKKLSMNKVDFSDEAQINQLFDYLIVKCRKLGI